jgi:hypothetical protein
MNQPIPIVSVPSLIPCPHWIGHQQFVARDKDINGDVRGTYADPIPRPAQAFYQTGTQQPISPEYAYRQVQELIVMVPDGTPYNKRDRVLVGGTVDNPKNPTTYSGGKAYAMDGDPEDYTAGSPFPDLTAIFGAQIRLKRVG